ncbi:tetratricopeptide repeat protein [Micromonospora sp. CA-249363]|uniref:AfsR/SARP family transcriptional regulator n=1 Tax=Micromonospora sp. CA-249363 TaxID=3239963 RepID=UPI003D90610F
MGAEPVGYRLLGPVQVLAGARPVDPGPPRQRSVLAALLVDAGRVVEQAALVDRVWGEQAPADARGSLRAHVTRIRQVLREAAGDADPPPLVHRSGGYVLEIDEDRVDLHRFRRLLLRAGDTDDDRERLANLRAAIGLRQGVPLAGVGGDWAARMRESWTREHLDAVVAWADAELGAHNPAVTVGLLAELAAEHPLVESLTAALMRAQHALGRTADALREYAALRTRLAEALGVDPEPNLQMLHRALLQGASPLPRAAPPAGTSAPVPAELPTEVRGFVGRTDALAGLDKLVAESTGVATGGVLAVISGTAGVGKTTLAVHWAHQVAHRFPDGQLYADLRGFDPGGVPVRPAAVLRGLLESLGLPPERIPADPDVQAARYRSLLAGKRIIVVLDNARDADQVRLLLPGTPTSAAVVTSRDRLAPLVTVHGAHPLAVDVLDPDEARLLLTRRLGVDRVAAEPAAVQQIIAACARLPLALAIVCARAQQTAFPLTAIAAELDDVHGRLDALDAGDPTTRVRAVFSWSEAALSADARRLFHLMSLHPGPDVGAHAVASLAGQPLAPTRRLLPELVRANLVAEPAPGRYALHDLLRAYAAEEVAPDERRAAQSRLVEHYVHAAHAANRLILPHRDAIALPLGPPPTTDNPENLADRWQAMAWFHTERPALLAALRLAAASGLDRAAWQLAWALDTYLERRGHWYDRDAAWRTALECADRLGIPAARAGAHRGLAHTDLRFQRLDDAQEHLHRAFDLSVSSDDTAGQAFIHRLFAYLDGHREDWPSALEHAQRAVLLYRAAGHERGEAFGLNAVGWCHTLLGDHATAVGYCERALSLLHRVGDRGDTAATWDNLGHAWHHLGQHDRAVDCYREALGLFRELGHRVHEPDILTHLGDAHLSAGDADAARTAWQQALDIFTDLDHARGESVRARLDALPSSA